VDLDGQTLGSYRLNGPVSRVEVGVVLTLPEPISKPSLRLSRALPGCVGKYLVCVSV
jgi:hypothetical protein